MQKSTFHACYAHNLQEMEWNVLITLAIFLTTERIYDSYMYIDSFCTITTVEVEWKVMQFDIQRKYQDSCLRNLGFIEWLWIMKILLNNVGW